MFLLLLTYRVNKDPSLPPSFLSNANNEQSFQAYVTKEGGFCASENVTFPQKSGLCGFLCTQKIKTPIKISIVLKCLIKETNSQFRDL